MEGYMLKRCLRKVDTGQWIDVLFTVDGAEFSVTEVSHRTDIADAIGVLPGELETVDAESDQRTGTLLKLPAPPASPHSVSHARIAELLEIPRSEWTTAQLRELLQLTAQEIT